MVRIKEEKISTLHASLELHYGAKGNHTLVESEPRSLVEEYAITPPPHEEIEVCQMYYQNSYFCTHQIPLFHPDMEATFGEKIGMIEPVITNLVVAYVRWIQDGW